MFLGEYTHSIDEKGRLTVPARFRQLLQTEGAYLLRGLDGNLVVMLPNAFKSMLDNLSSQNSTDPDVRDLRRVISGGAQHVSPDNSGRILVPGFLREEFQLGNEVKLVGIGDQFEIWSQEAWTQKRTQINQAIKQDPGKFLGVNLTSAPNE